MDPIVDVAFLELPLRIANMDINQLGCFRTHIEFDFVEQSFERQVGGRRQPFVLDTVREPTRVACSDGHGHEEEL